MKEHAIGRTIPVGVQERTLAECERRRRVWLSSALPGAGFSSNGLSLDIAYWVKRFGMEAFRKNGESEHMKGQ